MAKPFAAYVEARGARDVGGLSEELVESFLRIRPRTESRRCLRLLLQVLQQHGLVPVREGVPAAAQARGLLDEYVAFLHDHRGTSLRRAEQHRRYVASWLGSLSQGSVEGLQSLTGAAVQRFITARVLRVRAPIGPLRGVLSNHIKPYARKAGVTVPSAGAHAWRHACATRMLATGQSLKTIRHLLGHRSIETTFIYTKVDLGALRQAALEWPEGAP